MTVVVCTSCGARYQLKSDFELEGECRECGDEDLVAEDAYDPEPEALICTNCSYEVEGGPRSGTAADAYNQGRFTVDDPCPLCECELAPLESYSQRTMPEYATARAAAQATRSKYNVRGPWIDPSAVAVAEGLEVCVGDFFHQGRLVEGTIEVPKCEPVVAQRWVVAHELGHAALRHQVGGHKIEREANAFASEFLVPRRELRKLVEDGLGFRAMARTFEVSHQTLGWALNQARLIGKVSGR